MYPTSSNDLVEMMNSGKFDADSFKPTSKRSNRKKNNHKKKQDEEIEEETVGALIDNAFIQLAE